MTSIRQWREHVKAAKASGQQPKAFMDFLQASDPQKFAIPAGYVRTPPPPPTMQRIPQQAIQNQEGYTGTADRAARRVRNSNIYTQGARNQLATQTRTEIVPQEPGILGKYYSGATYGGKTDYIQLDPNSGPDTARHEYGHFFDDKHNITNPGSRYGYPDLQKFAAMYPGGGPGQTGALRENAFLGTLLAEKRAGNLWHNPALNFPGIFGNPLHQIQSTGQQWGGREELYATMNSDPNFYVPDAMHAFFPQFAPQAYQTPGYVEKVVRFEDGSVGKTLIKIQPRKPRVR